MLGCLVKVAIPDPKKAKIWSKTIDFVFIRYTYSSSAYRLLVHKSSIEDNHSNTIMKWRNATLFEYMFPLKKVRETHSFKRATEASSSDYHKLKDDEVEFRRSKMIKTTKKFDPNFLTYLLGNKSQTYFWRNVLSEIFRLEWDN